MRFFQLVFLFFCLAMVCGAEVKVTNVKATPRWPWNGKVDITFSIEGGEPGVLYRIGGKGYDRDADKTMSLYTLSGDGIRRLIPAGGPYTVVWDARADYPDLNSTAFKVSIHTTGYLPLQYLVVYLDKLDDPTAKKFDFKNQPPNLGDDKCRTTELWLRQIPAGTFTMGCDSTEVGYTGYEFAKHQVTITQMFYIGVFECTQRQWELVMGSNPSYYKGDCRPVEKVSYTMIRGADWPAYGHAVDSSSFMGKLQEKTGLVFDLPTEAQWEYACRAGTTTALNSGKNLTSTQSDGAMNEVGRYCYNLSDGKGGYSQHTKVGSYLPNAWGLYDMHGNVMEWCLDWWGANTSSTEVETDSAGPDTGFCRVKRGGYWYYSANYCRSATRDYNYPSRVSDNGGFRVFCLLLGR